MQTIRIRILPLILAIFVAACGDDGEGNSPPLVTPTSVPIATRTSTPLPSSTSTPGPTLSPTVSDVQPIITYFGISRADDTLIESTASDVMGRPIFERPLGQGFSLIVEVKRGSSGRAVGQYAYDESGANPDLQLLVSRPLGNGSPTVCALDLPLGDGIPATDPPHFSDRPAVIAAANDLGCRVNDGTGSAVSRRPSSQACTQANSDFGYGFVQSDTDAQFCLPIARTWSFPQGDTIVAVRVRDQAGVYSTAHEIIVHVGTP